MASQSEVDDGDGPAEGRASEGAVRGGGGDPCSGTPVLPGAGGAVGFGGVRRVVRGDVRGALRSAAGPSEHPTGGVLPVMLVVGYLEGIGSERGIAWRCAESLSLREFLGYELDENPPDHSTVSRTRRRLPVEAHETVFARVLELLEESGLLSGKTLGIDSTTLEGNAAMRSIVRRDTGEGYQLFLEGLAEASGIETPSRADLAKLDRKRPRKGSNDEWEHPHDPDARITKMKDGRTRMGHKLEHAVDMSSGAVCGLTVQPTTGGDCASLPKTLGEARGQLERLGLEARELVCDKGYHSNATMKRLAGLGLRGYVSEPNRGRRSWKRDRAARKPTYANRRRIRGARGKRLLRARGREAGARLRPPAHHGRDAPDAPARAREHP